MQNCKPDATELLVKRNGGGGDTLSRGGHMGGGDVRAGGARMRNGCVVAIATLKNVFEGLLNSDFKPGFLSMKMEPGKAYSMFKGIEHSHALWIDEAQDKQNGDESKVESWNVGHVLKIATGSKSSTFQYRSEYGKEKTVTLKVQSINVSSNKINLPDNPGIRTKLEASPYTRCSASIRMGRLKHRRLVDSVRSKSIQ